MINIQNVYNLVTYFIIYSFYGWTLESVYRSIKERKWINTGFLHGPFCPIYGIGAIIMYVFLYRYRQNPILVFFAGFIVLSFWEYVVGAFLEKVFKTKYWDYSNVKFNLQGRICLSTSICWGVLGVVFVYLIQPGMSTVLGKIPNEIVMYATFCMVIYLLVDTTITIIGIKDIEFGIKRLDELKDNIKLKVEELKNANKGTEEIQKVIEELKYKETRLRRKILVRINRLRKAFPNMK